MVVEREQFGAFRFQYTEQSYTGIIVQIVVGIKKMDVFLLCDSDTFVACFTQSGMFLTMIDDAVAVFLSYHLACDAVGRSIVNDVCFPIQS